MCDQGLFHGSSTCTAFNRTMIHVPILDFQLDKRLHSIQRHRTPVGTGQGFAKTVQ